MTAPDAIPLDLAIALVQVAALAGLAGGVLALSVWALVQAGWHAVVAGFDERAARRRLADRHYRELFGDGDD